ncbi:hypothetical protein [Neobacillus massiliamazoniensis]|uniref:hypothetical protein n=1 Tax=Neobacillus massiliamazoniensis TaxID=1499688 RepID=UPI000A5FB1CC|nr:hypothetical protein [Neobacillus massiliamazoniensis]
MRLKDGAPKEVRREFNRYIKTYADWQSRNEQGLDLPPLVSIDEEGQNIGEV